jgi:hypothetical protein
MRRLKASGILKTCLRSARETGAHLGRGDEPSTLTSVVLFRDGIGHGFGAPLEHLGYFSEERCLGHSPHVDPEID